MSLQFRISLKGIQPEIWRLIDVPDSYTFWDCHVAIQDAMGWKDRHLHQFSIKHPDSGAVVLFGILDASDFMDRPVILPGWKYPLVDYFTSKCAVADYMYDFGDDWHHTVVLEDVIPVIFARGVRPCIDGARACPPEDCGGPPGYQELVEVLKHPETVEAKDFIRWFGGTYDPEAFDVNSVKFTDAKARLRRLLEQ